MEYFKNISLIDIEFEEWADIPYYEGLYMVSSFGRVKSLDKYIDHPCGGVSFKKAIILKQAINVPGYHHLNLTKYKIRTNHYVHRLVAASFVPNIHNKVEVNHKDLNKSNNMKSNLEWATSKENSIHAVSNGAVIKRFGINNNFFGKKGALSHKSRDILQLDMRGKLVKEWCSITEAANELKVSIVCIFECCKGEQKTSAGYKWEYAN